MVRFDDILDKVSSYLNEKDILILQKAYVFAGHAHRGQTRRSGEPYLSHPLEVTKFLADMQLDRTTIVAALLHDVLEDTALTTLEIEKNFGKEVADLVEGVTKISRVHGASPETNRAETVRKVILAMTDDIRVIFIKLADRVHNLKTLKFLSSYQQQQIARETLDIYAPIANRLGMGRIRAELEDLAFQYVAPEEYLKINAMLMPLKDDLETSLMSMKQALEDLLKENNLQGDVFFRIKRPYSIWQKIQRQGIDFDQVYDLLALRIITSTIKDCYTILGLIHQRWSHFPQRFHDFIAIPKPNLYQSIHTTVITQEQKKYEIQIRTREMEAVAEHGIAAHWRYKEGEPEHVSYEDRRLHWLREMVALYEEQKNPQQFLRELKLNLVPEELYIFTPKGRVITLPPGATALDFAFKIHSEIGLHATGVIINGQPLPLKTVLKTGDIVEILTAEEQTPSRSWLASVATSYARQQIKKWLNLKSKNTITELGRKLWEKEFQKLGLPSNLNQASEILPRAEKALGVNITRIEDLFELAGAGKIVINRKLLQSIFPEHSAGQEKPVAEKPGYMALKPGSSLVIKSLDEPLIRLAKCCAPIKGESVVGYLTLGKGITVHSTRCSFVTREMLDSYRLIDVQWDLTLTGTFTARILIKAEDSPGILASVAAAVANLDGNIIKAEAKTFPGNKAHISLAVQVNDASQLESILVKLRSLPLVLSAVRI